MALLTALASVVLLLVGLPLVTNIGGPAASVETRLTSARDKLPKALRDDIWAFTALPVRLTGALLVALGLAALGQTASGLSVMLGIGLVGVLLTLVAAGVSNTVYNARHGGILKPQPWSLLLWVVGIAASAALVAVHR